LACIFLSLQFARAVTFQINDPVEFAKIIDTNAVLTTNANINSWLEGPVWIPAGGYLVFCDQGNNRLKKLVPPAAVTDFLVPAANTLFNGTILDAQERLIACEAGGAGLRVVMITNGIVTTLVNTCNGLKILFAQRRRREIGRHHLVHRSRLQQRHRRAAANRISARLLRVSVQPRQRQRHLHARHHQQPHPSHGLCFSPDESRLYIADSDTTRHNIRVWSVSSSNTLSGGSVFATVTNGSPDGIRCDVQGHVWSAGGDGAYIFATDGHLVGQNRFQEYCRELLLRRSAIQNLLHGRPASRHVQFLFSWPGYRR